MKVIQLLKNIIFGKHQNEVQLPEIDTCMWCNCMIQKQSDTIEFISNGKNIVLHIDGCFETYIEVNKNQIPNHKYLLSQFNQKHKTV